jgi:glycine/D-amino acid oxidase-like deaminating enzyme
MTDSRSTSPLLAAPETTPVEPDREVPKTTTVVVIGGGVIGVSAALHLAERGVPVVLCEKGRIAGEQSSRNWGWVRNQGRDPRELALTTRSLEMWRGMNERLGEEVGFRTCGILYLDKTEKDLASDEAWMAHARAWNLDSTILRGAALDRVLPGAGKQFAGALYTASDGRAEPQLAVPAMARAARRAGARILVPCAVRGIETAAGRISGVVTEHGAIACQSVILAGGAWSRLFLGNLGIELPQLKVRGSVIRTGAVENGPGCSALGGGFAFRKRLDGGYTVAHGVNTTAELVPDSFRLFGRFWPAYRQTWRDVHLHLSDRFGIEWSTPRRWALDAESPFERERVLDPRPQRHVIEDSMRTLVQAFPEFASTRAEQAWGGFIDVTPDAVPVIEANDKLPGLAIATGFSGHGFGIGPAAGMLAAELATGATPSVDPKPFRLSRFTDGSPFEFHGL